MKLFGKKSTLEKVKETTPAPTSTRGKLQLGLITAAGAVGVTALSSAVSALRRRNEH